MTHHLRRLQNHHRFLAIDFNVKRLRAGGQFADFQFSRERAIPLPPGRGPSERSESGVRDGRLLQPYRKGFIEQSATSRHPHPAFAALTSAFSREEKEMRSRLLQRHTAF